MTRSDTIFIDMDQYKTVINGQATYEHIAYRIKECGPIYIPWTDQEGTQYDILFCMPKMFGPIQRGIRNGDFFVAVQGFGMWAWDINENEIYTSYMCEKLHMPRNTSTDKLAELLTGVRLALHNLK